MFKKIIIIIILITRCFHRLRTKKFSSPCSRYFFFFISKYEKITKGSLSSFGILIEKIYLAVKGEIYLTTKERKRGRGKQRNLCPTKFS